MARAVALALLWSAACGSAPTSPSAAALDGVYTLRILTNCAALPPGERNREYAATIAGGTVTLSGATFWMDPREGLRNTFAISVLGERVRLTLEPKPVSAGGIVEQTSPTTYFGIVGEGQGSVQGESRGRPVIAGSFSAGFGFGEHLVYNDRHVGCASGAHDATFRFDPDRLSAPPPGIAQTLQRIELSGPSTIAPGETVQFEVTGHLPDGTTRDLTAEATWSFRGGTPLLGAHAGVGPGGVVTGRSIGDGELSAHAEVPNFVPALSSRAEVIVTPPGTFRLAGRVTLGGLASDPVVGALVTATGRTAAALSATTDWDGRYKIFGVSGPTTVRVIKAGYADQTREVVGVGNEMLDVALPLSGALPNVAGSYTLTVEADPTCAGNLPEGARARQYPATIVQVGSTVEVRLTGAAWDQYTAGHGDRFPGRVQPDAVIFELAEVDYWGGSGPMGPYIGELLSSPPGWSLTINGRAKSTVTADGLPGVLDGALVVWNRSIFAIPRAGDPMASCSGAGFSFAPR
ncbi:MAG TPA: carboxypeptidase-like regulatory domain-containing protein [Vicinamibacterales bacterium]|nr:carboxypeptidase-like regulatory domain-containing protein [Vicinamibacterales bacterium]